MKLVYIVLTGDYTKTPVIVCQNEDEAKQLAISINQISEDVVNGYIRPTPFLCDPNSYDVNDIILTAIKSTERVYVDAVNAVNSPEIKNEGI